nr:hypothetical protein [Tanacetum cinerariifolium]
MSILYTLETKVKKMMSSPFDKSDCVLGCKNTEMVPLRKMRQLVLGNRVLKPETVLVSSRLGRLNGRKNKKPEGSWVQIK